MLNVSFLKEGECTMIAGWAQDIVCNTTRIKKGKVIVRKAALIKIIFIVILSKKRSYTPKGNGA
jgi:hypothetical protein